MRIGIDIDGTLTNFEKFVANNSKKYMKKKYGLELTNPDGYDLDEMYELEKRFLERGLSEEEAKNKSKKILDKYWNKYFIKYLFTSFRPEVKDAIKALYYSGNQVEIFSSRKKTTQNSALGKFVRNSSLLSLRLHGIKVDKVNFFEDDESKIEAIKQARLHLLFDDKPEVIKQLSKNNHIVCIDSSYNREIDESKNITRISDFSKSEVLSAANEALQKFGEKQIENDFKPRTYDRLSKSLSKRENNYRFTDKGYRFFWLIGVPSVKAAFKPIVLNKDKNTPKAPIIVSPNHRSTLDPFFVSTSTKYPIHWAALKRFFNAEDSIFNNSKKPILCKFTSVGFRAIGSIPVERQSDNPNANNRDSIRRMNNLVKENQNLGIFPEGTTNKNPEESLIGEGDRSGKLAFALLRENINASMLPVSIMWIKKSDSIKNKVIINYRDSFNSQDVENYSTEKGIPYMDAAYEIWKERIIEGLKENKELIERLQHSYERHKEERPKSKRKVYYKSDKIKMR